MRALSTLLAGGATGVLWVAIACQISLIARWPATNCQLGGERADASLTVGMDAHLVGLILEIAPTCCFVQEEGGELGGSHCAEELELHVRGMACIMN